MEEKEKEKEKDREEQDKLGPLRPLTLSKSAPVMAAVLREAVQRSASESASDPSASIVHKSASATPLSLVVQSPPAKTEGLSNMLIRPTLDHILLWHCL